MRGLLVLVLVATITPGMWKASTAWSEDNVKELKEDCYPRHVHLSLGETPHEVKVMWAARTPCLSPGVKYGTSPWHLELEVTASSDIFTGPDKAYGLHYLHKATLTGLMGGMTYYYRPVCDNIGAGPFFFRSPFADTEWSPHVLVTGPLGADSQLLPVLSQSALSGQYCATLQLGALSAYFTEDNDTRGDQMMQGLQQTAAYVPLMTAPGEYEEGKEGASFPVYSQLFSMPGGDSERPGSASSSLWYSFHLGPVHFISICTALYLHGDQAELQEQQHQWLKKDLRQANEDRYLRPWIVVFGSHPLYCSRRQHDQDCGPSNTLSGLEALLFREGVDLILQSHNGGYRRLYPLYNGLVLSTNYTNPHAPVHLVLGTASPTHPSHSHSPSPTAAASENAAGDSGVGGTNTSDSHNSVGDGGGGDSEAAVSKAIEEASVGLSAVEMMNGTDPAYGRLQVINATHAYWELLSGRAEKPEGEVLDSFWLVQENHGPRHIIDLPKDLEDMIDDDQEELDDDRKPDILNAQGGPSSSSHPHPLGDILRAVNSHRRVVIGVSLGGAVLVLAVLLLACRLRRRRGGRRGVVPRRWDTADYKYGKTKLSNDVDFDDDDDFKEGGDNMAGSSDDRLQTKRLIDRS